MWCRRSCLDRYTSEKPKNNDANIRRTLNLRNFELKFGGLPAAIGTGEATRAPGRATMDLGEVGELLEAVGIAEGHEDQAVMDEGGHDTKVGALLTT